MKKSLKHILYAFLIGAIYLSFFDYLQTICGIEIYTGKMWSLIKVPFQFGFLAVILSFIVPWFEKNFIHTRFKAKIKKAIFEMFFFGILYLITLGSNYSSISTAFVFICITIVRFLTSYQKGDWQYCLFLGILGPMIESCLVELTTFKYNSADLFNVPLWLPLLWANGGFLARRLFNLKDLRNTIS